jgi:hypothetical protein
MTLRSLDVGCKTVNIFITKYISCKMISSTLGRLLKISLCNGFMVWGNKYFKPCRYGIPDKGIDLWVEICVLFQG